MNLSRNQFILSLTAVFLIAFGLRLGLTQKFVGLDAPPDANANSDQIDYELLAWHLADGQGYVITPGTPTASRTPGTSLTLAPIYAVFGHSYALGRVWFCWLSAVTCLLAAWLGTTCFNRAVGLIAGLALALYPGHAYNAMHFVSETPFGFWLMSALIVTMYAYRRPRGGWEMDALAGLCWALAMYTRPQLLLALPVAGALAFAAWLFRNPANRIHLKRFALQAVILSLVLAPWVVRNAVVMHKPTISTITGYGLWGSHNELTFNDPAYRGGWVKASLLIDEQHPLTGTEAQRNDQAASYGIEAIKAHADQMPTLIAWKLWRLVTPFKDTDNKLVRTAFAISWFVTAPLLLLGLVISFKHTRTTTWLLMLPILATIASTVVFYGSIRFRDSVAPAFILFAAVGAQQLFSLVIRRRISEPLASLDEKQPQTRAA